MERLTKQLGDGRIVATDCVAFVKNAKYGSFFEGRAFDKLAAYEDAEEQGMILFLPISRDTPVYSIEYCCGRNKNNQIGMCVRGFCKDCNDKAYFIRESTAEYCSICEIQKSVFFTREEAEAKLKEMNCFQNGNN